MLPKKTADDTSARLNAELNACMPIIENFKNPNLKLAVRAQLEERLLFSLSHIIETATKGYPKDNLPDNPFWLELNRNKLDVLISYLNIDQQRDVRKKWSVPGGDQEDSAPSFKPALSEERTDSTRRKKARDEEYEEYRKAEKEGRVRWKNKLMACGLEEKDAEFYIKNANNYFRDDESDEYFTKLKGIMCLHLRDRYGFDYTSANNEASNFINMNPFILKHGKSSGTVYNTTEQYQNDYEKLCRRIGLHDEADTHRVRSGMKPDPAARAASSSAEGFFARSAEEVRLYVFASSCDRAKAESILKNKMNAMLVRESNTSIGELGTCATIVISSIFADRITHERLVLCRDKASGSVLWLPVSNNKDAVLLTHSFVGNEEISVIQSKEAQDCFFKKMSDVSLGRKIIYADASTCAEKYSEYQQKRYGQDDPAAAARAANGPSG